MNQPVADYFFQILRGGSVARTGVLEVRLVDEDLVRGNDDVEIRTNDTFNLARFNGFTRFVSNGPSLSDVERVQSDGEVSTQVTFTDGTSISGVLGLLSQTSSIGGTSQQFLLDQNAFQAAGKSYADIARVNVEGFVDHALSFADLGFNVAGATPQPTPTPTPTPVPVPTPEPTPVPIPDPEPTPEPELNIINGSNRGNRINGTNEDDAINGRGGNDRINGRDGDDIIRGGGDNDHLRGGAGADAFVFGDSDRDRDRDVDRIHDFDASEDVIVLEDGASIRRTLERNDDLFIQLDGDRDWIIVYDQDRSILDDIVYENGTYDLG